MGSAWILDAEARIRVERVSARLSNIPARLNRPIHASLTEMNRRLDTIEDHHSNLGGVTKEIDEIRGEVRAIQKHLGIERKIAA
jgi:hypothetical protein